MAKKTTHKKSWIKTLKGLSVATIVFASLSVIISIVAIVYLGIAIFVANSTETVNEIASNAQMAEQTYIDGQNLIIGNSQTNIMALANLGFGFMLGFTITSLLTALFSMFVSIFTIIKSKNKKLEKTNFTLHIISIICSFFTANFIRMILIIIASVYSYKISYLKIKH